MIIRQSTATTTNNSVGLCFKQNNNATCNGLKKLKTIKLNFSELTKNIIQYPLFFPRLQGEIYPLQSKLPNVPHLSDSSLEN